MAISCVVSPNITYTQGIHENFIYTDTNLSIQVTIIASRADY